MHLNFGQITAMLGTLHLLSTAFLAKRLGTQRDLLLSYMVIAAVCWIGGIFGSHLIYSTELTPFGHSMLAGVASVAILHLLTFITQATQLRSVLTVSCFTSLPILGAAKLACLSAHCCVGIVPLFGALLPVQLFEMFSMLTLGIALVFSWYVTRHHGIVVAPLFYSFYSAQRVVSEQFRVEHADIILGYRAPVIVAFGLFLLGLFLFVAETRRQRMDILRSYGMS
jgi:hypothetical protein